MAWKKCCCGCMSVRTGTRIIGILSLIVAVFGFAVSLHAMTVIPISTIELKITDDFPIFNPIAMCAVICVSSLLQLVLSGLLLNGIQRNQESRCKPWLYYNIFALVNLIVFCLGFTIFLMMIDLPTGIFFAFIGCIPISIQAYLLTVVRDYIRDLHHLRRSAGIGYGFACPRPVPTSTCVYSPTVHSHAHPPGSGSGHPHTHLMHMHTKG